MGYDFCEELDTTRGTDFSDKIPTTMPTDTCTAIHMYGYASVYLGCALSDAKRLFVRHSADFRRTEKSRFWVDFWGQKWGQNSGQKWGRFRVDFWGQKWGRVGSIYQAPKSLY